MLRGVGMYGDERDAKLDIVTRAGRIVAVTAAGETEGAEVVDLDGLQALPGVIDAHTHPIHDETFESVGAAAPRGGVTTALHHLYPEPGEPYADAVARATASARLGQADYGFHVRITPDRLPEGLAALAPLSPVVGAKLFLAHSDPSVMSSYGDLYTALRQARDAKVRIVVHAELGEVLNLHEKVVGDYADLDAFQAARPTSLEAAAVATVGAIAEMTNGPVYIAHVSAPEALDVARAARDRGVDIAVESCPHYFFLDATAPLGGLGRVTPPLRRPEKAAAMRDAISRGGSVDVMGSDHCGYGEHEKFADDVTASSNGLPGIELMLPLFLDAAASPDSWVTPRRVVELLCEGPARTFGITRKGRIAPGFDADLTLVDPAGSWTVDGGALADRSFYSPYHGRTLKQRIERVYRRGEQIYSYQDDVTGGEGAPVAKA
ncbi:MULTISPECIES: dihydroorotase family protein [unclassified Streptomyces]|uniref:dihydroorotase n=1 Tax=unclassified Streptomyces TaxID=2593676 RepID=UPI0036E9EF58